VILSAPRLLIEEQFLDMIMWVSFALLALFGFLRKIPMQKQMANLKMLLMASFIVFLMQYTDKADLKDARF